MLARLFGLMVLRGAVYGALGPFLSVVLLVGGLPLPLLGPLAGVGALITLVVAPWWGRLGDRFGRRRTFAFAMLVGSPVALLLATDALPLLVLGWLAFAFISTAYVPLGDSLTLDRIGGRQAVFARMRLGASSGYMAAIVVVGWLITNARLGWDAPAVVCAVISALTVLVIAARLRGELRTGRGVAWAGERRGVGRVADSAGDPAETGSAVTAPVAVPRPAPGAPAPIPSAPAQVRRHARFLVGMTGIFAATNAPSVFVGPRVAELGGSGWEIGLAAAAGTLFEVPAYLLIGLMLSRLGARRTFGLGALLLGSSGVLSALVPTPELVIVARLLFGAGYSWIIVPSIAAIAAAGGPRERASLTGLHFATSAAGTLSVAILGLPLVAVGGTGLVLVVASLLGPLGGLVALSGWPREYAAPVAAGEGTSEALSRS